jgi:hypothetical protein
MLVSRFPTNWDEYRCRGPGSCEAAGIQIPLALSVNQPWQSNLACSVP